MWQVLGFIAVILSIIYFRKGRNAVWGGLTIGAIVGLIIAVILAFRSKGFNLYVILKAITVGIIVGFLAELLDEIPKLIKKQ